MNNLSFVVVVVVVVEGRSLHSCNGESFFLTADISKNKFLANITQFTVYIQHHLLRGKHFIVVSPFVLLSVGL